MPKWSLDESPTLLVTHDAPRALVKQPDFDLKPIRGGDGLSTRIRDLLGEDGAANTLTVDLTRGQRGLIDGDTGSVGFRQADRLEQARRAIDARDFSSALTLLGEVLAEFTSHREATYLKALCEHSLGESDKALETLAGLPRQSETDLGSRTRMLRSQARRNVVPSLAQEVLAAGSARNPELDARLEQLIAIDSDGREYHILLLNHLIEAGDADAARRALLRAGSMLAGRETAIPEGLAARVERLLMDADLSQARELYRTQQYRDARRELDRHKTQYASSALWKAFHGYVSDLSGGLFSKPLRPADTAPRGEPKDVEELYAFLTAADIRHTGALLEQGAFAEAEKALLSALPLAPRYAYLNFLYAGAAFKRVWQEAGAGGREADESEIARRLEGVRTYAEIGAADPEIPEAAALLRAIVNGPATYRQSRDQAAREQRERTVLDNLAASLIRVVSSAKDGIQSAPHFHQVRESLQELDLNAKQARQDMCTDAGRERLTEIFRLIADYLKRLDEFEPEILTAEEMSVYHRQLERIMGRLQGGACTLDQLQGYAAQLDNLKRSVARFRESTSSLAAEAKCSLDELDQEIRRCGAGVRRVLDEASDGVLLGGFENSFRSANRAAADARGSAHRRSDLAALRAVIESNQPRLKTDAGRIRGAALLSAVDAALAQNRG